MKCASLRGGARGRRYPVVAALAALFIVPIAAAACSDSSGAGPTGTSPAVLTGAGPVKATPSPAPPTARPTAAPPRGTPATGPIDVPIFMYHHVAPTAPADAINANLTVLTPDFERQMAYLRCAGYTGITLAQLFDSMYGGAPLPAHPVILTFDDGYSDVFVNAFPLLQKYGFPASFAIITSAVGGGAGAYMTWDQLQTLTNGGMEITSHTVSHVDLGTSDDATDQNEITASKAALEQHLGKSVDFFVYPSGEPFRSGTVERQRQVVAMLKEAGYRGALLAGPNSLRQDPATPFALNRVRVSGGEGVETYAGSIGGPSCDG